MTLSTPSERLPGLEALYLLVGIARRRHVATLINAAEVRSLVDLGLAVKREAFLGPPQVSITPRGQAMVDHFITIPLPTQETTWTVK